MAPTEILIWLDDHSRYALHLTAHMRVTGPIVRDTFRQAVARHGVPASTLTDNGMVFTTRLAGGRRGRDNRNALETELRRLQDLPRSQTKISSGWCRHSIAVWVVFLSLTRNKSKSVAEDELPEVMNRRTGEGRHTTAGTIAGSVRGRASGRCSRPPTQVQ